MAIAVVLCAALGGCTDEKKVGPIDDPSTTSTPSPTPSKPTAPPLPADAKGETPKAAAKFVEHYIALMNHASATGDVKALQNASRDCKGCDSYIRLYEITYANGGYFRDTGWKSLGPIAQREGDHITVLVDVDTPDTVFKTSASAKPTKGLGGEFKLRFEAVPTASSWVMTKFERQTPVPKTS